MKKFLRIFLAVALMLSFSLSVMADTRIHYTYTDTESGIVYHYGSFDSTDTDAGVKIGDRKYSLKSGIYMGESKNAFEEAKAKNNQFIIGLKADEKTPEEYSVIPYSVDAEGNEKLGHAITVDKNAYTKNIIDKTVNGIVTDDLRSENQNNDQNVNTNYTTVLSVKGDYLAADNSSQAYTVLIKIDLRDIKKDAYKNSNFHFTINGKAGSWAKESMTDFKVGVIGVNNLADWDDGENMPVLDDDVSYNEAFVKGRAPLDYVRVPVTATNYEQYTFNITSHIQKEIAKGSDFATIALFADSEEAIAEYNATGKKNRMLLTIKSSEAGADSYSLTYQVEDPADKEAELKSLTIGGETVDLRYIDSKTNTYTKYLPNTTYNLPEVSCTVSERATSSISVEDNKATITIVSKDGSVTNNYYVDFVISESMSDEASLAFTGGIREHSINGDPNKKNEFKNVGLDGANIVLFESFNHGDYGSHCSFFQFDLSQLSKPDLSEEFEIAFSKVSLSWDTTKMSNITLSVYDVTDSFDWATDGTTASASGHEMEPTLKDPIDTVVIPTRYINSDGIDSPFSGAIDKLNISEFIRKCLRDNILYPTVAFDIEFGDLVPLEQLPSNSRFYRINFSGQINSSQTNLVYSKLNGEVFDRDAYSTPVLSSIKIDGEEINLGYINPENNTYTRYLPKGVEFVPEVTAEGNEYTEVSVTQATSFDDMAVITATALSGDSKTIYVKFVTSNDFSVDTTLRFTETSGIVKDNAKVYSASEQSATSIYVYGNNSFSVFNRGTKSNRTDYVPVVGYMQLDLTKLTDVDLSKEIILNTDSYFSIYDRPTTNTPFSAAEVSIYDASEFDWVNTELTTRAALEDMSVIEGKTPVAKVNGSELLNPTYSEDNKNVYGTAVFNISEYVRACISKGNLTPTLCFYVSKTDTTDRVIFRIRYRTSSYNTYIAYSEKKIIPELSQTNLEALYIDEEEVNLAYLDEETKTYTKYLPYGTEFISEVSAKSNDYAEVTVIPANSVDGIAEIKVKAYNGNEETYYVDFVVSESMSDEKSLTLKIGETTIVKNMINGNYEISKNNLNKDVVNMLNVFEAYNDVTRYLSTVSFFQLDLNELKNADMAGDFSLVLNNVKIGWDGAKETADFNVNFYDVSDRFDWATEGTTTSTSGLLYEDTMDKLIATKIVSTKDTSLGAFDFSEFIRHAIITGNYNPTIALDIEFLSKPSSMKRYSLDVSVGAYVDTVLTYNILNGEKN